MKNHFAIADDMSLTIDGTLLATRWFHIVHSLSSRQRFISSLLELLHHRASLATNFINNADAHHLSSRLLTPSTLNFLFNNSHEQHDIVLISVAAALALRFPVG